MEKPTNLLEAIRYFSDVDVATDYVARLRWPDGFVCPHCGGREYSYLSTRRLWKCKSCQKQSSVKVGTILEDSALGLDKWLPAIWLAANATGEMSSHELARRLGTTQKSAWLMLQRIREAQTSPPAAPSVEVESPKADDSKEQAHFPDLRTSPAARPQALVAVAVVFFALGALFGWLAGRLERRGAVRP